MAPVPNATLDAGDSTPKVTRASLILTVEAVNQLYSFMDADTSSTNVQFSRNVGVTGTLNVSGMITGNVTGNLTGNASTATSATSATTATKWATSRSLSITGDLLWSVSGVDGSANATAVGTLASVNGTPGSFGSAANSLTATINAKGLVTAMASAPIAISTAQVTSGTFADARFAASNVTQYQTNLAILETQVTNGALLARVADSEIVTGLWTFNQTVAANISGAAADLTIQGFSDMNSVHLVGFQAFDTTVGAANTPAGSSTVAGTGFEMRRAPDSTNSSVGTYQMFVSNGSENQYYLRKIVTNATAPNEVWGPWSKILTDQDTTPTIGRTATTFDNTTGIILNGVAGQLAAEGSQSSGQLQLNRTTSDGTTVSFLRQNATVGSISVTASATTYNTSSDYRLKNVIGPLTNSGVFIDALKPKVGTWIVDGTPFVGFLAHEFQEVSPTSVTGEKDGTNFQTMEASSPEVIANMVAELQSLRARNAVLEDQMKAVLLKLGM